VEDRTHHDHVAAGREIRLMNILLACGGLALLVVAGDLLVRGAVAVSLRLGIPALIVSLTIVAFGTSAPEMLIGVTSALEGVPGIALGNVVGSNIANVLLVLGIPALISGLDTRNSDTRRSYLQMIGASVVFIALCFMGPLGIVAGVILLVLLAGMILSALREAGKARDKAREIEAELAEVGDAEIPTWKIAAFLVAGLVGLPVGAHLLITGAQGIASAMGVSDEVIGLTLVAVGTSLPELATTVMAAWRRQADVAMGNVIGSNLFNILAIMGVTSFFGPLPIAPSMLTYDLWVMLAASLVLAPFVMWKFNIGRGVGIAFLAAYVAYTISLF